MRPATLTGIVGRGSRAVAIRVVVAVEFEAEDSLGSQCAADEEQGDNACVDDRFEVHG